MITASFIELFYTNEKNFHFQNNDMLKRYL